MRHLPALIALGCATLSAHRAHAEAAAVPYVQIADASVVEGDAGRTKFSVKVSLTNWQSPVEVIVSAVSESATEADFVFEPVRLKVDPGGEATVSGEIIGDTEFEGTETFTLRATAAPGVGSPGWLYSSGGRVEIKDDDGAHAPLLSIDGATVREGDEGLTPVELPVHLQPASAYPVTVDYTISDAAGGGDVQPANGTLTFAPGETRKVITAQVIGDRVWETDHKIPVTLSNPRHALLASSSATIVITNDDPPLVVSLADAEVVEGNSGIQHVTLTLKLDHPAPPDTKVHVNVVSGSADASDFQPLFQVVYPQKGATSASFTVDVYGDTKPECDEGVIIEYAGVYTGDDARKIAHLLIKDDDGGPRTGCANPFERSAPPWTLEDGGAPPALDAAVDVGLDVGAAPQDAGSAPDRGSPGLVVDAAVPLPPLVPEVAVLPRTDAGASGPRGGGATLSTDSGCSFGGHARAPWLSAATALTLLGLVWRRRRR